MSKSRYVAKRLTESGVVPTANSDIQFCFDSEIDKDKKKMH